MDLMDVMNNIVQIAFINIFTYVVFMKITNYKEKDYLKMISVFTASIIEGTVGTILSVHISILPSMIIVYSIHSGIIAKVTNNKFQYSITTTFISLTITYLVYIISIVCSSIILKLLNPNIQNSSREILYLGIIIEFLILNVLFKMKRFKDGFAFLRNKEKIDNIGIVGFILIGISLLLYSLVGNVNGRAFNATLLVGMGIVAICITVWIRRKITKYYKQKMKEKTIEDLENEIKEKDIEISKILDENKEIATINHKYSTRISALEKISAQILSKPELVETMRVEFGADFGDMQEQIKKLSEEYTSEITAKIKHENKLAKTGIFGIDNILEYMKEEAERDKIKFDLKINGNINYMVENIIDQSKLETLLGDHLKDAIIAIKSSDNTYKSILTIIGIIDDSYEICIYDTGIEFEIETLLNLGTEPITTHKETGGSGIGFMTTFETLRETKGSLIIEEKHPMTNTDYTKAVRIRFDGKREYKIISYRAEEIKKQRKNNKIIIQEI